MPAFSQTGGTDPVDNNATSVVNGHIKQVTNFNNILVVAFTLQSDARRLANATLKFTYNDKVLKLEETPIAESPRDTDNKLSNGDYFFHNRLSGSQDAAPAIDNGYKKLTIENGKLLTGNNIDNQTYQITVWNEFMDANLNVASTDVPKLLDLNTTETILTLKFKIIGSGPANLQWLNAANDYEIIVLNNGVGDNQPEVNLTAEDIYVQLEEEKKVLILSSTGTGTVTNPILVNATPKEPENIQAGAVGFYVYFNTSNTIYDPTKTLDLLKQTNSFNWPEANITVEEISPAALKSFTVYATGENRSVYYNRRIKYISNAQGQTNDQWLNNTPKNILSLVFDEVVGPKGIQPIDIYLEAITGEYGSTTTFKNYAGGEHGVIERQRVFEARDNALPVTLTKFTATAVASTILLDWATASEINNKEFVVEKSLDARTFETVTAVAGGGNSTSPLSYAAVDSNPTPGTSYYRLKQIDFDGKFEYSKIVSVTYAPTTEETIVISSLYPNPFQGHENVQVQLTLPAAAEVQIHVLSLNGNVLSRQTVKGKTGLQTIAVEELSRVPGGVYLLKIVSGNQVAVQKIVKSN
ncbi:MAG: T9SS type A sorting domain-containing protein [Rufibacter sp.]